MEIISKFCQLDGAALLATNTLTNLPQDISTSTSSIDSFLMGGGRWSPNLPRNKMLISIYASFYIWFPNDFQNVIVIVLFKFSNYEDNR